MFLTSTSDIIRVVTASVVSTIGVHADWVDNATGTYTPGRTNTAITGATTTTVVASPGSSTVRNVRSLSITNNHATSSNVITIQHYDGTTSVDIEKITLKAGEKFDMAEDGEWRHLTAAGAEYEYSQPAQGNLGITGTVAETMPREFCTEANGSALSTGRLTLVPVMLRAGQVVTSVSFFSATTAANTPTNQFFALYNAAGVLLAQSANDTTTAWAANTVKTLALTGAYTVQATGLYYIGIMVTATTVPTLKGFNRAGMALTSLQMLGCMTSTTGLTTALPENASLVATNTLTNVPWAAIT